MIMGYCMRQVGSSFFIAKAKVDAALEAMGGEEGYEISRKKGESHASVQCWSFDLDDKGNITGIHFGGEKKGYGENERFARVAPFVKAGSYVEMSGEDGARWRYVFDGKKMKEIDGKISWPEDA